MGDVQYIGGCPVYPLVLSTSGHIISISGEYLEYIGGGGGGGRGGFFVNREIS